MDDIIVILAILLIVGILTIFLYVILINLVKEINNKVKSSYLLKLEEIDKEKPKEKEVKKKEKIEEKPEEKPEENVIVMENATYRPEDLLKKAKEIDEQFNIYSPDIIKKFIKENVKTNTKYYNELKEFKESLSGLDESYLTKKYDKNKIISIVPENFKKVIEKYFIDDKIELMDIIEKLDIEINKNDPNIYVYTGNKNENYNYLDKRIITKYDKNIYKGIKIYYQNKLYDFSLE